MFLIRFLRRSLLVRAAAVVVSGLVLTSVLINLALQSTVLFRLFPDLMHQHAMASSELVFLIENVPDSAVPVILSTFSSPARSAYLRETFPEGAERSDFLEAPFRSLPSETAFPLPDRDLRFRRLSPADLGALNNDGLARGVYGISGLEISIELNNGRILSILLTPAALLAGFSLTLPSLLAFIVAMISVSVLFVVFRPLKDLVQASQMIGLTSKPNLIPETGTEDIRRVAHALNQAQLRVKELVSDRSRLVAALAHDVRTYLTHMKLRLEGGAPIEPDKLKGDISNMEQLISDMLLYARAERPDATPELIDLNQLVSDIVETLPFEVLLSLEDTALSVAAERSSLRRAILNLVQNAHNYGSNVHLVLRTTDQGHLLWIEDNGPGIPEEILDRIFDPFFRVEPSRNRQTGGSGLGLSIAKSLLSAQGVTLELANRTDQTGLRAEILFPMSVCVF